ncbi:MAG: tetratricopeptide repeat protein [Planctomycetota bacterium]|jgi:tetratricopeptide (TPR) repeat protein
MSRTLGVLILACLFGCGQQPIESLRTSGDRLYERGDYASAAAKYAQIADRYPGDWEAHYRLGLCRLEMGELSAARTELKVALTNRPRDPDVVDALAETMLLQGHEAELFSFVKEHAESERTVRAWLRLARYAARLGDADSAQTALETAIVLEDGRTVGPYLQTARHGPGPAPTPPGVRNQPEGSSRRPAVAGAGRGPRPHDRPSSRQVAAPAFSGDAPARWNRGCSDRLPAWATWPGFACCGSSSRRS